MPSRGAGPAAPSSTPASGRAQRGGGAPRAAAARKARSCGAASGAERRQRSHTVSRAQPCISSVRACSAGSERCSPSTFMVTCRSRRLGITAHRTPRAGLVSTAGHQSGAWPGVSDGRGRRTLRLQAPPARGARMSGARPPPRRTRRPRKRSSRCVATRRRSRGKGARPSRGRSADARGHTNRLHVRSNGPRQAASKRARRSPETADAPGSLNVDMPALADTPLPVKTTRERAARASASAAAVSSAPRSESVAAAARTAAARRGLELEPQQRCGKPAVSAVTESRRSCAAEHAPGGRCGGGSVVRACWRGVHRSAAQGTRAAAHAQLHG